MGNCGHQCSCSGGVAKDKNATKRAYLRAIVSFIMLIVGILLSAFNITFFENQWVRLVWYIVAYFPVGLPVLKEAWEGITHKDIFSEFTLMSIATIGAFYIGEYPEGVAVMLFYSIGELFQDNAVSKAKKNISALLDVRPETANLVTEDGVKVISPEEVKVGDIIEVKVGERVPLDGVLMGDSASFNTAALTGESVPRTIKEGETVLAGMILTNHVSRIKVAKPFGESALARILNLVQNATERKAPAEKFIRKFARVYTPIVVTLAVLIVLLPWIYSLLTSTFIFSFDEWLYRGLIFLVISCPCALVISVPLGYFGGIGAASRLGILFKGSNYMEAITKINTVVMDKTGTMTQGVFDVQQIVQTGKTTRDELLKTIASVEMQSNHPIAKAIVTYAKKQNVELYKPQQVKEIAGYGLQAIVEGRSVLIGNTKLLQQNGIYFPVEINEIAETIVVCAIEGTYAGYILVADAAKPDAKEAIVALKQLGIKDIVMLSGDKQSLVTKLAAELGISQAYGDLLPEGKVEKIEELKQDTTRRIAFVGDGINDAPVLALSDVGIAMGGLGSDVAIETADVIIQTDQPSKIATALKVGKATRRIVMENICLAFGVKLVVLILGAGGIATLWEAVFADVGVSLLAVLNAIRILKMKF